MKLLHKTAILHQRNGRKLHKTASFRASKLHKMAKNQGTARSNKGAVKWRFVHTIFHQNAGHRPRFSMKFVRKGNGYCLIIKEKREIIDSKSGIFNNIYPLAA